MVLYNGFLWLGWSETGRIQSTFIDSIVAVTLVFMLCALANCINEESATLKITAVIIGFSYEPLLVCYHRTIGQMIVRMKVTDLKNGSRPLLPASYLRFVVKSLLGSLSFILIFSDVQRRAIHDHIAGTLVVNN